MRLELCDVHPPLLLHFFNKPHRLPRSRVHSLSSSSSSSFVPSFLLPPSPLPPPLSTPFPPSIEPSMSLTEPTPQRTWLLLFAYWATCAVVTLPHHLPFFSPSAPSSTPAPSFLAAFAVLATLLNGALFWSRAGRGRRRFSLVAALAFPLANGVVETFAFFLAFDLGVAASEFLSAASIVHFAGRLSLVLFVLGPGPREALGAARPPRRHAGLPRASGASRNGLDDQQPESHELFVARSALSLRQVCLVPDRWLARPR